MVNNVTYSIHLNFSILASNSLALVKHETTAKYLDVLAYEFELNESQLISFSQTSYFLKQTSYYK